MFKLMITDDEALICAGLEKLINWSNLGIQLCPPAYSAEAALKMLADEEVDILITDIRMPGLNGVELIRWARSLRPDLKCIVLSSYSDYEFIRQAMRAGAMDYLLKPIRSADLEDAVRPLVQQLERKEQTNTQASEQIVFERMMQKLISGEATLEDRRERMEYFRIRTSFSAAVFLLSVPFPTTEEATAQLKGCLDNPDDGTLFFPDRKGNICALITANDSEVLIRNREEVCARLSSSFERFVISPVFKGWRHVPAIYRNCLSVVDHCLLRGVTTLSFEECQTGSDDAVDMAELWNCLSEPGTEGSFIERYLSDRLNMGAFEHRIVDLLHRVSEIYEIQIPNANNPDMHSVLSAVRLARSYRDKRRVLEEVLFELACALKPNSRISESPVIRRCIAKINASFSDESLCLKTIAASLNVNPSYLGRQFKAAMGVYFNDYLTSLRIRHAERLLKTTDMRIADIAAAVGFSSLNYFGNVYKKIMLCTPGETRKSIHVNSGSP